MYKHPRVKFEGFGNNKTPFESTEKTFSIMCIAPCGLISFYSCRRRGREELLEAVGALI